MKRIWRILLASALVIPALIIPTVASAATTVYANDLAGWQAAVNNTYSTEDFTDATLNPGVSVTSTNGYVDTTNGVWFDIVDDDPVATTLWTFAAPISAFGGTWDLAGPGGPGTSIKVSINDAWVEIGVIPNTTAGTFWGFVSDVPFTKVLLESDGTTGIQETYTMDNMVYSQLTAFVTGGGNIKGGSPDWSFGGMVGYTSEPSLAGQFQIVDHVNKVSYHTTEILSLSFSGDPATTPSAPFNTANFTANFTNNRDANIITVTVIIQDLGEKAPKTDTIELQGGLTLAETTISGGNFQVHP